MIAIIDYGMGNLGSVKNACAFLGLPAEIIQTPERLEACDAVILPGVGAFGDCMRHLSDYGFVEPIRTWLDEGKPFLGICLGLQVLFETSEESPEVKGLSIFPGTVKKFRPNNVLKVPQMGWNSVCQVQKKCPLFKGLPDETYFYFVHSYYVDCSEANWIAGTTEYGLEYTSVIWKDHIMAAQFHPEKSQKWGLAMLKNFAAWVREPVKFSGIEPSFS
ncbi:MAG: imidazole glycerol phosphate synthase subunit HisH [Kiritimatiellae bacterium]|nr:imidazole glycerol phosphate synthase subunit HisH [Kiritimatiellia bacterium]